VEWTGAGESSSKNGSIHLFALGGSVGGEIIAGASTAGGGKATSPHPQRLPSQALRTCLVIPVARLLASLTATLEFGGQVTSVLGRDFRFCLLSLPITKGLKEMSGAGVSLNFML